VGFSRSATPAHVQDLLQQDGDLLRALVQDNAQVLVCGGRPMAANVAAVMDALLLPLGLSVHALRASDRYLEDTY
jgi:sulfite reductase (NADPH) flavoprotein alpha-component